VSGPLGEIIVAGPWAADTRVLFTGVILLVVVQRLVELRVSNRHVRLALAQGGVEAGSTTYPRMVLLHAAVLTAAPAEVWLLGRPWVPELAGAMLVALLGAQLLRYWAISTLGTRWTTRVIRVPGSELATTGPYRWLRHPNYAAVVIEFLAIPLLHTAWVTALAGSVANLLVLRERVAIEEQALGDARTRKPGRSAADE